jgi:hypothetical protein
MPIGEEYAVNVRPNQDSPMQVLQWAWGQKMQREQLDEAKKERAAEAKKQQRLGTERYLDEAFDFNKIKTGVIDQDALLQNQMTALRQQAQDAAYRGELGEAELRSMMRNGLMEVNNMSESTKTARDMIDASLKPYEGSKSLNVEALKKAALRKTFFDRDEKTGELMQKKADQIRPADLEQLVTDDPYGFVNKDLNSGNINHGDLETYMDSQKGAIKEEYVDQDYTTKGGKKETRKVKVSAMRLPGQQIVFENGKPTLKFETQSQLDKNNKPIEMINEDSYNRYFATKGARTALEAETRQRYPDEKFDPRSYEGQQKMKVVALDLLNKRQTGTSVNYTDITDAQRAGYNIYNVGGSKEEKKETRELDKSKESGVFQLMNPSTFKDIPADESGYKSVINYLTGGKLLSTRKEIKADGTSSVQAFSDVGFNKDGRLVVKDNPESKPRTIPQKEEYGFLKKIAESNNMSAKHFDKLWQESHPDVPVQRAKDDDALQQEKRQTALKTAREGGDIVDFRNRWLNKEFTITTEGTGTSTKLGNAESTSSQKWKGNVQLLGFDKRKNRKGVDEYFIKFRYPGGEEYQLDNLSKDQMNTFFKKPVD